MTRPAHRPTTPEHLRRKMVSIRLPQLVLDYLATRPDKTLAIEQAIKQTPEWVEWMRTRAT